MDVLTLSNVEVIYDKIFLAIKGISVRIPENGMVALLGANGAGKSTTLKSVSGLLKPERGEITRGFIKFLDHDIVGLAPPARVKMGIAHVLEGRRVFEHLTPMENLVAASMVHANRQRTQKLLTRVHEYFPALQRRRKTMAGYLSGGEQQMLAIARALMGEPKMLMLDEPSLGLAPLLVKEIFGIVRLINKEEGVSILLVEQNAKAALDIVTHGYLIENGRTVMEGPSDVLIQNPDIKEFYLGGAAGSRDYHMVKHYSRRKRWLA
ncbi:MAG: ABC transporter ATP-binding protein [Proteobacteria bacterium]|nr:ABC transporter ATP-binding protein [Pseudomonadota bacterium]